MSVAPIIKDSGTKETGTTLLLIDRKDGEMILEALELLAAKHKRRPAVRRILFEAQSIPVA